MKIIVRDWLHTNRATPVRVFENNGILYLDHALSSIAPEIEYSENALFDFASAYYPKSLLEFSEKHGTLFHVDQVDNIASPFADSSTIPTEQAMRDVLQDLGYPDGKKRLVTQDIKWIQKSCLERDSGYAWYANQREYFGDLVAARALIQIVLRLLGGESREGWKGACPDFSVNLAYAPRYKAFLEKVSRPLVAVDARTKKLDGAPSLDAMSGLFVKGDRFYCRNVSGTVEDVVSNLVTMHLANGVTKFCEKLELHESYTHLLQVIWLQIPEQIGTRLIVSRCENPRCGNVMLKLRNVEKHACCTSCQQTLKEGR